MVHPFQSIACRGVLVLVVTCAKYETRYKRTTSEYFYFIVYLQTEMVKLISMTENSLCDVIELFTFLFSSDSSNRMSNVMQFMKPPWHEPHSAHLERRLQRIF